MMAKQMRIVYPPGDIKLDENQNVLKMYDIEKMAFQILKVCQAKVSPVCKKPKHDSNHNFYPSDHESEEESSKSIISDLQTSTCSTSESESSIYDTEADMRIAGPKKSEKGKKITVLQRSHIEVERFRPIRPEPKLPPRKEVQPLRPIVKQVQSHLRTAVSKDQLFQPIIRLPQSQPYTGLEPIRPILLRNQLSQPLNKMQLIPMLQEPIVDQHNDLQQLENALLLLQKTLRKAALNNRIMYNGRNVLNLAENLQPQAWQLQSALHKIE